MSLDKLTYKTAILKTKRGNNLGVYSNAKPILLISLIEAIDEGIILGNKIIFDCKELEDLYKINSTKNYNKDTVYKTNNSITPYRMPFFHLNAEPYFHIKWKEHVDIPRQAQSPSVKFLIESIDYAYFDEGLWKILQDREVREEFLSSIIEHFLIKE